MTSEPCFICLKKSRNKVCPFCKCYAHTKCWGKYLYNELKITFFIQDDTKNVFAEVPMGTKCPQCRRLINQTSMITRSLTKSSREIILCLFIKELLKTTEHIDNFNKYENILKNIYEHKILLKKKNIFLTKKLSDKLKELNNFGWNKANIYHLLLFNKQC